MKFWRALGFGGMGEVYKAKDTKLKRDVKLKVLPAAFLRDPERMARFQREAEVLASGIIVRRVSLKEEITCECY